MFYNFSFFAKPSMDFIHDDKPSLNILRSTVPIPVHDLKIKLTDFDFFFFFVKSLECQLLQSLWLISIVFGMNGYKILKCFRKEQRVSGELPCPATGLICFNVRVFVLPDKESPPADDGLSVGFGVVPVWWVAVRKQGIVP